MRTILIVVCLCGSLFAAAQDSVKERWLKFEIMPFNSGIKVFSRPGVASLPESVQVMYDPKRNYCWGIRSFNLRMVIADRFVFGGGLDMFTMPVDKDAVMAKVEADNPGYFIEMGSSSNEYNTFNGVLFAGARFRFNSQWCLETMLDFRAGDPNIFAASLAFKDSQSSLFFTRSYRSDIDKTRSLGFHCNILRFGKKFPNLFFGAQLSTGTDLYKGTGYITDFSYENGTTVTEFAIAQRYNFVSLGAVVGLRFFKGSFE